MSSVPGSPTSIEELQQSLSSHDPDAFRIAIRKYVKELSEAAGAKALPTGVRTKRLGIHYSSMLMGRWFRGTQEYGEDVRPFGSAPRVVEWFWEKMYEELPKGTNLLVDGRVATPLWVQFGGAAALKKSNDWLFISNAEYRSITDLLNKGRFFENLEKMYRMERPHTDMVDVSLANLSKRCLAWLKSGGVRVDVEAFDAPLALYSLEYTWAGTFLSNYDPEKDPQKCLIAVTIPVPSQPPPSPFACIGGLYLAPASETLVGHLPSVEEHLRERLEKGAHRLFEVEAEHVSASPGRRGLAVERSVRHFRFVSTSMIRNGDRLRKWRELFPAAETSKLKKWDDTKYKWWDVPLWGCSERMHGFLETLEKAFAGEKPRVDTGFLLSGPGCGKETLAKLCHFMSPRSYEYARLDARVSQWKEQFGKEILDKILADEPDRLVSVKRALAGKKSAATIAERRAGANKGRPWEFNYFVIDCANLHEGGLAQALFGSNQGERGGCGYLAKASLLGGTIFLDEINTLPNASEVRVFLRLFEGARQMPVSLDGKVTWMDLDALFLFGSNSAPAELVQRNWSSAVMSRIAPVEKLFEVPPLRERPEDIPVTFAYKLQYLSEGRVDAVSMDAMRLVAALPWSRGSFRDIHTLASGIVHRRSESAIRRGGDALVWEVRLEDVLDAFPGGLHLGT